MQNGLSDSFRIERGQTVSTDQDVVVIRVTVLYSCKGCLGPRIGLVWKCADVTRVITIWPLEQGENRKKRSRWAGVTRPSREAPNPARPFR